MIRRLFLFILGFTLIHTVWQTAELQAADETAKTVQLTIDYGDGVQKTFTAIEWKEKQTVFDVLQAAEKHPRGIKLKHRGSGAALFVSAIDDKTNEGAGSNWTYEVNGTLGDRSCAIFDVAAGDKLLWKFAKSR